MDFSLLADETNNEIFLFCLNLGTKNERITHRLYYLPLWCRVVINLVKTK